MHFPIKLTVLLLGCFVTANSFSLKDNLKGSRFSKHFVQKTTSKCYGTTINYVVGENKDIVSSSSGLKKTFARILGYVMGAGSMALYTPIIIDILRKQNADGMSIATWVYNFMGFTAGIIYPLKKGFPLSSYIDNAGLWFQSLVILFLTCFFQQKTKEFGIGMLAFSLIFGIFLKQDIPASFLGAVQMSATAACNYAQIPQIILNWNLKSASWSFISAFLSVIGNFLKIFTTIQLTNDKLICFGHILGFTTNSALLYQIMLYNKIFPF